VRDGTPIGYSLHGSRAYAASCRMLGAADLRPALAKGSTLNVLQDAELERLLK
jgi:hypothetical protein